MRRREFIALAAGSAAGWPLATRAQQPGKLPTIGFFGTTTASAWTPWVAAFVQRLHELGWVDGRTVTIVYRWANGRSDLFPEIAAELVRSKVDVIVTSGGGVGAAKQATANIPIVFALAVDPIGAGLVSSLARPGGNVTGMSMETTELAGKRLEFLQNVVSHLRRIAIMLDVGFRQSVLETAEVEAAANTLHIDVVKLEIRKAEDIVPAFKTLSGADALYVCTGPLANTNKVLIDNLALDAHLPTMLSEQVYVEAGGLMAYGPDVPELFRRTAEIVDKILRGAKPADIPVEQPTKFELTVNLKTAKSLGLVFPPTILALADEVIE
jgi:putative ABC transport system substrate-binding protein